RPSALRQPHEAQAQCCIAVSWHQLQGSLERCASLVEPAQRQQHIAEVVVERTLLGRYSERPFQQVQRRLQILPLSQDGSEVLQDAGMFLRLKDPAIKHLGASAVAGPVQSERAVEQGDQGQGRILTGEVQFVGSISWAPSTLVPCSFGRHSRFSETIRPKMSSATPLKLPGSNSEGVCQYWR
ncbi:MAG: hypothetical protein JWQ52_823, partial [Phenylobacterium sp.]|nr:hypothetical protein [Phenylobacterium sp.]